MLRDDAHPVHAGCAEPRAQALDEPRPVLRGAVPVVEQGERGAGERHDVGRGEREGAHRRGQRNRAEPLPRELGEVARVAARRDQPDRDDGRRRVAMAEPQLEPAHAAGARGEEAFELHEQALRREEEVPGLRRLGRQLEARVELRRRDVERARVGAPAVRAVEVIEKRLAEAAREAVARKPRELAHGARADRVQGFERVRVAYGDAEGEGREREAECVGVRDALRRAGAGEPRGAARGGRAGAERGEAHARAARDETRADAVDAAEELQAARDLERERGGKIGRDVRGELRGPAGEPEQGLGLLGGIARADDEVVRSRECGGHRHAGPHAAGARLAVAGDHARVVRGRVLGDRLRLRRRKAAGERFEREVRQVQRDPLHGERSTRGCWGTAARGRRSPDARRPPRAA